MFWQPGIAVFAYGTGTLCIKITLPTTILLRRGFEEDGGWTGSYKITWVYTCLLSFSWLLFVEGMGIYPLLVGYGVFWSCVLCALRAATLLHQTFPFPKYWCTMLPTTMLSTWDW